MQNVKEDSEFAKFPNLRQNWLYFQDYQEKKVNWEEEERFARESGIKVNLEALIGKEDECDHNCPQTAQFEEVTKNYWVSEVFCPDCGKLLSFSVRKTISLPLFRLEDIESNGNEKGVDIMSEIQNKVETVTASVNAEDFHEEEGKSKRILQPFVAICPVCGWKNIIDAKCARKKKMGNCSHCHSKTWLNIVGKLKRFGRNGQYFKIVWLHGAI
jgi:hypothetical protein